jgi:hypothetical protein
MANLIEVKPLKDFKLYLKYSDGTEGEISTSNLRNKKEFESLNDYEVFSQVFVDEKTNDISWKNGLSICKNAAYRQVELKSLMKSFKIDIDNL